ncbi:hypothetical protein DVH24_016400 [Malus domestica]|uniref:Cation-transporting P-type ATPase C-terminal domain-containing protein n=1 Tax=Malus domestica TaxID=3750 RepID=A0A498HPW2_MALDO|nr:hypothetical protein DVH24_016400 [Malus domestica]
MKESVEDEAYSSNCHYLLDLIRGVAFNMSGSVYRPSSGSGFEFLGPTEKAILSWATLELHMPSIHIETKRGFDEKEGGQCYLCALERSCRYDTRNMLELLLLGMAASSLRCIALAHKQAQDKHINDKNKYGKLEESSLILRKGSIKPYRPGVREAVEALPVCRDAGGTKEAVVEGVESRNYTPEQRMQKVNVINVMARSSTFDKLLMVQCLKQKGYVVVVTVVGKNDVPTLKEVDIGLSMGIQSTEVAKESSDFVILDDKFATLRASAGEVPLIVVQLLWMNLIMDTMAAQALITDKPAKEIIERPLVGPTVITNIRKSEERIVLDGYCGTSEQVCGCIAIKLGTIGACIGSAAISWPIILGKPIFSCLKRDSKHGLEYLARAESPSHCTQLRIHHLIYGAIPNIMEQLNASCQI